MLKVFERKPLDDVNGRDVILAGKVIGITDIKESKAGNKYLRVTISGSVYDPELEMEVEETEKVIFLDKVSEQYGEQLNATNAAKLKIREGSQIAIRAQESEGKDENGNPQISYFGQRAAYTNGVQFNYKFSKRGDEAVVIIGTAVVNEKDGEKSLSIPVRKWDKDKQENYTAWCHVNGIEKITVDGKPFLDTLVKFEGTDGKMHNPVIAVSFKQVTEVASENDPTRVGAINGDVITAVTV